MKITLKAKLIQLFCTMLAVIIMIWLVFYAVVHRFIYIRAERQMTGAITQITEDLSREFSDIEKLCYRTSQASVMKAFMLSADMSERLSLAAQVDALLLDSYNLNFVSDIVAINADREFYRFTGNLSNASCSMLARCIQENAPAKHVTLNTVNGNRLGCAMGVYDAMDNMLGTLIILTDEEKLGELMYSYTFDSFISIAIAVQAQIITASGSPLQERYTYYLQNPTTDSGIMQKQMGLTPFMAVTALDTDYLKASTLWFSIAAIITLLSFAIVITVFIKALQKLFLAPMLSVMENTKQVAADADIDNEHLLYTGQEDFDLLVDQINSMIIRLDEKSRTLFEMQYKMQNTELEKQRAIIISLKKQINAHFTVNTLNVIRRLNDIGENENAGNMCAGLSFLLRYANGAEEFIGGMDEIFILQQYVDIMLIRYPKHFTAEFDVDDELDDFVLPRMLLQPIIENAITHGILSVTNGRLSVTGSVINNCLRFTVSDNGIGMSEDTLIRLLVKIKAAPTQPWDENGIEHIALPNIQKRVVSIFGDAYGISIVSVLGEGTAVTLKLPARQK